MMWNSLFDIIASRMSKKINQIFCNNDFKQSTSQSLGRRHYFERFPSTDWWKIRFKTNTLVCAMTLQQFVVFQLSIFGKIIGWSVWHIYRKIRELYIPNCKQHYPANIYIFKVNNRKTSKRCLICSKLTIKTRDRRQWCRSGIFIITFEHISHLFLAFLLLTLK